MYHEIKGDSESGDPVYLEMQPGDTVFSHPPLIHGSGANMTNDFRNDCVLLDRNAVGLQRKWLPASFSWKSQRGIEKTRLP